VEFYSGIAERYGYSDGHLQAGWETLTGTYKGRFGEAPLKGTVKGNEIKFTLTISPQGQDLQLDYTGTVDGDTMKGKVKFGDLGEGNFSGKESNASTETGKWQLAHKQLAVSNWLDLGRPKFLPLICADEY